MTDEQININIAELCGWTFDPEELPDYPWFDKEGEGYKHCPNYTADLNAMHEAEKRLTDIDDWMLYDKALAETTCGFTYHAPARHRAEAFLRVLGLWED